MPRLQQLFDANPEYFLGVGGVPAAADEAVREFHDTPPAGLSFHRMWTLGFVDAEGRLVAMATVVSDFLANGVWHIGLFLVATSLHGTGVAHALYRGLEDWMIGQGAQWIRLGAVKGNLKAERFWHRMEYRQVRERAGMVTGQRTNTLRVMVKAVAQHDVADYLALVQRDNPDQP